MLFNSVEFILFFLPAAWLGWRLFAAFGLLRTATAWLALASLAFYSWWDWRISLLLVASLVVNFGIGRTLATPARRSRAWLLTGLAWNLCLLSYFKYWDFFATNVNTLAGAGLPLLRVALPLGISFFTFQKIAFLVDAWRGRVTEVRFGDFALFVLFFPQLIAGPIVHHGEFIPQLRDRATYRFDGRALALGLTVFIAGLFMKVVVADTVHPIANSAFGQAALGEELRFIEAWAGLIAYSVFLYFDFAGYSVMALGLGLLFGLRLPVNFLAPYTAGSLIDFWRRWHMTLSAFLRDYLYIPLGGNRKGFPRQMAALLLTMLLAGFWHGAGWTFVLWGAWHGVALCLNHIWRRIWSRRSRSALPSPAGRIMTLAVVLFGWVLFRSPDLATARLYFESLAGWHGISVPVGWVNWVEPLAPIVRPRGVFPNVSVTPIALAVLAAAAWSALSGPNILRWLGVSPRDVVSAPAMPLSLVPEPRSLPWTRAAVAGAMFALVLASLGRTSPFVYFQF